MKQKRKVIILDVLVATIFFVAGTLLQALEGNGIFNRVFQALIQSPAFLSATVGVLSIIFGFSLPFFIYQKEKNKREISWNIVSDIPIISIKEKLDTEVQILLHGHPISNARLLTLKIWNTGNVPILREDYNEPISFSFGSEVKILTAEIVSTLPATLKVPFKADIDHIVIGPLLLNRRDTITFQALITGNDIHLSVNARINNLNELSFKKERFLSQAL